MIPPALDHVSMLNDLRDWGWLDFKIETVCGFGRGYVAQLRCYNIKEMSYNRAARLHNFWEEEQDLHWQRQAKLANSTQVGVGSTARA